MTCNTLPGEERIFANLHKALEAWKARHESA